MALNVCQHIIFMLFIVSYFMLDKILTSTLSYLNPSLLSLPVLSSLLSLYPAPPPPMPPPFLQGEAARFPMVSEAARWLVRDARWRGGGRQVRATEITLPAPPACSPLYLFPRCGICF